MSDRLLVATRKGLFILERARDTWAVTRTAFLGEPVTMALSDPADGRLYAALRLGHFGVKLHRSADGGASWEECAVPSFPAAEGAGNAEAKGPALDQIWALERAGGDRPGELLAGTIPGALFRSRDRGDSWELVASLWNRPERAEWAGGGYDQSGLHSICVDPRDPDRVLVGISVGGAWRTEDGGAAWALSAQGMFAEYMPPPRRFDQNVQDPHRIVSCPEAPDVFWCQHHNGVFRSTDGARSWTEVSTVTPSGFGFAVAVHPADPDTAWFVPAVKDECRIPVDGQVVVARTRDGGLTFTALRNGLPQEHAYDLIYRHALDVDGGGNRLAMGSTTGTLWLSENQGDRWEAVAPHLPPIYGVRFEK